MKKAKIYIPTKTAMQSGRGKTKNWILEFYTRDSATNPLMGWETSDDTMSEVILEFSSKELAINYAKKKKIDFDLIEPKKVEQILEKAEKQTELQMRWLANELEMNWK